MSFLFFGEMCWWQTDIIHVLILFIGVYNMAIHYFNSWGINIDDTFEEIKQIERPIVECVDIIL
jgi:uncharacterized membrane protein YiaA